MDVHELVGVVVVAVDGDRMTHVASARDFETRAAGVLSSGMCLFTYATAPFSGSGAIEP